MKVAVIMGSSSDFETVKPALDTLKDFGVQAECHVLSAHRTSEEALGFARNAKKNGFSVILAAAGKAAHLPGVLASVTTLPVIGIPIKTSIMGGMDSLFSIVQMPKGIPVLTVAVDGAVNAALGALRIIALSDENVAKKYDEYVEKMRVDVLKSDAEIQDLTKEYLDA
ncbi:5-(carboxyamino)imidazole ribonucleotide mutase [Guggenheimella bovis]